MNKSIFAGRHGFTLVELLVVISIIGILTTLLVVNFVGSRERARDSQKMQNLNEAKNALRLYYNDNQKYPDNIGSIVSYMPAVSSMTGVTYTKVSDDSFRIVTTLESGAGDDDINSQSNCGIAPVEKVYAVCSN